MHQSRGGDVAHVVDINGWPHRGMAEDAAAKHLDEIERKKYAMRGHTQNLAQAHAYYAEQAANPHIDQQNRDLWKLLERQTGTRLGLYSPPAVQEELFPEDLVAHRSARQRGD
jgi:hypothetical protein